ncbi:hypothetical protein [Mucilaginibacter antarcticus]|uniref:Uncharacterized protein n=1 Tax=Mucilaginibacter antarcticus TaxID=1855725 RepID=A0ABW5XUP5_9SPHI
MAALPVKAEALESVTVPELTAILKSGPYLQAPTTNSIIIRCITNSPVYQPFTCL